MFGAGLSLSTFSLDGWSCCCILINMVQFFTPPLIYFFPCKEENCKCVRAYMEGKSRSPASFWYPLPVGVPCWGIHPSPKQSRERLCAGNVTGIVVILPACKQVVLVWYKLFVLFVLGWPRFLLATPVNMLLYFGVLELKCLPFAMSLKLNIWAFAWYTKLRTVCLLQKDDTLLLMIADYLNVFDIDLKPPPPI